MIDIDSLTLRYRTKKGLGPVSFHVDTGEILGVIGPNGAGKTTLFSILAGIIRPQSGHISFTSAQGETHVSTRLPIQHLGFLPETPFLQPDFTPIEALQFDAAMRKQPLNRTQAAEHLTVFNAHSYMKRPIRTLSQGQSKRVELACAFHSKPEVLILDEPLNGLDIHSVIDMRSTVLEAKNRGATILISSHILTFIDEVADRIIFLKDGMIAGEVTPHETKAEEAYTRFFINTPPA